MDLLEARVLLERRQDIEAETRAFLEQSIASQRRRARLRGIVVGSLSVLILLAGTAIYWMIGIFTDANRLSEFFTDISVGLQETEEGKIRTLRDMAFTSEKIADLQLVQGSPGLAVESFKGVLSLRKRLIELDPGNKSQRDLLLSHYKLAKAYSAGKAAARDHATAALSIAQDLSAKLPDWVEMKDDLAAVRKLIADIEQTMPEEN